MLLVLISVVIVLEAIALVFLSKILSVVRHHPGIASKIAFQFGPNQKEKQSDAT